MNYTYQAHIVGEDTFNRLDLGAGYATGLVAEGVVDERPDGTQAFIIITRHEVE